jgi:ADP-ribosylglycohydrolase
MRIAPVALFMYRKEQEELVQAAVEIGAITHADPRSVAACASIVVAIAALLQGLSSEEAANRAEEAGLAALQAYTVALPADIQSISELLSRSGFRERGERLLTTFQAAYPAIQQRSDADIFRSCFRHSALSSVPDICTFSRDYAYKILAIAMWTLRQERSYEEVVLEIVREGGDADTNAAVAGAVYGAKIGLAGLPERLLAGLVHRDWLARKADLIVSLLPS